MSYPTANGLTPVFNNGTFGLTVNIGTLPPMPTAAPAPTPTVPEPSYEPYQPIITYSYNSTENCLGEWA